MENRDVAGTELNHDERDRRWVERIQDDDRKAFGAMFRAYVDHLSRFAHRFVQDSDVVDDLIQDVFLRIWRRRQVWDLRGTLRPYLYGAVRNRALKYIDRQRVRRNYAHEERAKTRPAVNPPEEHLRKVELEHAIQECLDELPARRKEVFVLSRYHGLTYKEIAETMGISVKTVETQMMRSLKLFRNRLARFRATAA